MSPKVPTWEYRRSAVVGAFRTMSKNSPTRSGNCRYSSLKIFWKRGSSKSAKFVEILGTAMRQPPLGVQFVDMVARHRVHIRLIAGEGLRGKVELHIHHPELDPGGGRGAETVGLIQRRGQRAQRAAEVLRGPRE